MVLALEKWCHWLEGAQKSFIIWTDHKNLIYLKNAKRLHSHQARRTLFLGCFNFTLSYSLSRQNAKPDTISRQSEPDQLNTPPETILPPSCFGAADRWGFEQVQEALKRFGGPLPGPDSSYLCPLDLRSGAQLQPCFAILGLTGPWGSSDSISGPRPWLMIPESLWPSAPEARLPMNSWLVCYVCSQCRTVPGHILWWT